MDNTDLRSRLAGLFSDPEAQEEQLASPDVAGHAAVGHAPAQIAGGEPDQPALQENESQLRTILDNVRAGVLILDPETHTIVDVNVVAAALIGAPKERIVGSMCHKFVCPADKGRCPITDLGQLVDNAERVLLTADGGTRPILKTVAKVMLDGREHLLESFVDITDRKAAEADRERLLQDIQVRTAHEQAINAAVARIRAGLTVEQVLNATAQEIGTILGAARVAVQLGGN